MRTLTQFSAQRYCFFLICANIFEKICNYLHMWKILCIFAACKEYAHESIHVRENM